MLSRLTIPLGLTILWVLVSRAAFAQSPAPSATLPALTPVLIQFDEQVSSDKNKNGDRFRFHVAADVRIGDLVVIPMGTPGVGEVIHAAKSGIAGKAGELIVAARYVTVGTKNIRLRSFTAGTGQNLANVANWTSVLAGAVPSLLIQGGKMTMPHHMLATVRTAETVTLPATLSVVAAGDEPMNAVPTGNTE
jgi:hypothetical protein